MPVVTYNHKPKAATASVAVAGTFKVGDKVKCISAGVSQLIKKGETYTVHECWTGPGCNYVRLKELLPVMSYHSYEVNRFELVVADAPVVEHKHAALMKLAAEKPETRFEWGVIADNKWWGPSISQGFAWHEHLDYRVYQEPKPDVVVVKYVAVVQPTSDDPLIQTSTQSVYDLPKVEFIFDGETKKLKSVKLL